MISLNILTLCHITYKVVHQPWFSGGNIENNWAREFKIGMQKFCFNLCVVYGSLEKDTSKMTRMNKTGGDDKSGGKGGESRPKDSTSNSPGKTSNDGNGSNGATKSGNSDDPTSTIFPPPAPKSTSNKKVGSTETTNETDSDFFLALQEQKIRQWSDQLAVRREVRTSGPGLSN
jgi:hypothetical protein